MHIANRFKIIFLADNLNIDFIGSQTAALINGGLLTNYQPDIVLLMAGTNDILRSDDASTVIAELNQLIDILQEELPDVPIFVSDLAPIDPAFKGEQRANIVAEVNAQLSGLAEQQGSQVTYVNGSSSLGLDDLVDDGIHPSAAGYQVIGDAWYDALVEQDTLTGITHLQGTEFSDRLTGNDEANILFGNGGADTLGGQGADSFVYESFDAEIDTITDFSQGDRFIISASGFDDDLIPDSNLTKIDSETGVFFSGTTSPCSIGTSPSFFYETETGILSFDRDGTGTTTAVEVAILTNMPTLRSEQFAIVA